jgi:hypothetical protein
MTPYLSEIHQRSQRFHAEIARRASMVSRKEVKTYFIPNTPFGAPKIRPNTPRVVRIDHIALFYHTMWFWDLVNCPPPSALNPLTQNFKRSPSVQDIQRATASHFGISLTDLVSERRTQPTTRIRQTAMYLAKILTTRSVPEIGRRFGGRDHTTVLHAVHRIEQLIAKDEEFAGHVAEIKAKLA